MEAQADRKPPNGLSSLLDPADLVRDCDLCVSGFRLVLIRILYRLEFEVISEDLLLFGRGSQCFLVVFKIAVPISAHLRFHQ